MKSVLSLLALLAAPVAAQACEGVGVCGQAVVQQFAVQSHCAPVAVQSFGVASHAVQVQSVVPFGVQTFSVAPQVVVLQQAHGHHVRVQNVRVQNVRQPRVRSRTVTRTVVR